LYNHIFQHADRYSNDSDSNSANEKPKRVFVHIQNLGPKDTYVSNSCFHIVSVDLCLCRFSDQEIWKLQNLVSLFPPFWIVLL